MRLALFAILLAWTPFVRAEEPSADPLIVLLTQYAAPVDQAAAGAPPSAPEENGARLAKVQSNLAVVVVGFEALRSPEQTERARRLAADAISPELRPFFKDRDATLDTAYRTLAVVDYTWALRFPEPPCAPRERRLTLLKSRDGLFADPGTGAPSPWLERLLGPASYGRTAEDALDRASAAAPVSAGDYERLRARWAKITKALKSDRAAGATRSKLYCERADVEERLAGAHRSMGGGTVLASRSNNDSKNESASVLLLAAPEGKGYRALGAAFLIETAQGQKVVTDSSLFADPKGLVVFRRPAAGGGLGEPYALTIERSSPGSGPAVGRLDKDPGAPALKLSASPAALGDMMRGLTHLRSAGPWTVTQGLVTAAGDGTYQTDALISPEMTGSPMLNERGEVVGLVLGRGDQAAVLQPAKLREFLDGGAVEVAEWRAPSNAGSAALLTSARPLDFGALAAPGGAAIESGLPTNLGGVNWEGGGGLGNFRPTTPSRPTFSPSSGPAFKPSATGGGSLPPSSPFYSNLETRHAYDGTIAADSPVGLVVRLVHWIITGGPFDLIAKGLNSLPKSGPSFSRGSSPVASAKAEAPRPPPPPPPKEPLKPSSVSLSVDLAEAVVGDTVTLTAVVTFTGEEGTKANVPVNFLVPADRLSCGGACSKPTNAAGISVLRATVIGRNEDEEAKLQSRVDSSFSALDKESAEVRDEEDPEPEETRTPPADQPVESARGLPPAALQAEAISGLRAAVQVIGMSATVPNAGSSENRELRVMLTLCPSDTVAANAYGQGLNAGPGQHVAQDSLQDMTRYTRCDKQEAEVRAACDERGTACRGKKLRELDYDFNYCPKRVHPSASGSKSGQSAVPGRMRPFQYVKCVPKKDVPDYGKAYSDGGGERGWLARNGKNGGGGSSQDSFDRKKNDQENGESSGAAKRDQRISGNEASAAAAKLGYEERIPPQKAPFNSHGQSVFRSGNKYITPDLDSHSGGVWKMFDRSGVRLGTFDANLNRIGD